MEQLKEEWKYQPLGDKLLIIVCGLWVGLICSKLLAFLFSVAQLVYYYEVLKRLCPPPA